MKTRIIQTKFWEDSLIQKAPANAKYLFMYILTCSHINMTGIFELSDKTIMFDTGLTEKGLEEGKEFLSSNKKVLFKNDWVKVINMSKYNNYNKGEKLQKAYEKELSTIPEPILKELNTSSDTTIEPVSIVPIIHNTKIINNKTENSIAYLENIPEEDIVKFTDTYAVSKSQVIELGEKLRLWCITEKKKKDNYRAFLQNRLLDKFGYRKKVTTFTPPTKEVFTEEQMAAQRAKVAEAKSKLLGGLHQ